MTVFTVFVRETIKGPPEEYQVEAHTVLQNADWLTFFNQEGKARGGFPTRSIVGFWTAPPVAA